MQALKTRMKGGRGKVGKGLTPSPSPSRKASSNATAKLMRKWNDSSVSAEDMAALDYSSPAPADGDQAGSSTPVDVEALVSNDALGTRTKNGAYEVADWDFRRGGASAGQADDLPTEEEILSRGTSRLTISKDGEKRDTGAESATETTSTRWGSMFSRLTGSKVLSREDLKPVLAEMEKHLMDKNVAKDIAEKLCESVGAALVGKKLGGLTSKCCAVLLILLA